MKWIALFLAASPAFAADYPMRDSDVVLDRAAMDSQVIGETHEFFDGGQSFFSISGTYTYTYSDGLRAYGRWEWPTDGREGVVCTIFRHGFERCDLYVRNGDRLVLITADGLRLPVRLNSADG
ncbi:MAG: hypothetical protein AAGP08_07495 [Pseudomonadota bacterium]